uniref:Uncharacterized protein n=1 Tax=Haptolina ericina TaxID=156174 RepID=A0A7S3F7N4_9EUKA
MTRLQAAEGRVVNCDATLATASEDGDKLKRAAKRHELLLQRLTEVQEARAGELRSLVKAVVDQLTPLQTTSRQHASQIEELSSGVSVLADLVRFNNRSRSTGVADALRSAGAAAGGRA